MCVYNPYSVVKATPMQRLYNNLVLVVARWTVRYASFSFVIAGVVSDGAGDCSTHKSRPPRKNADNLLNHTIS